MRTINLTYKCDLDKCPFKEYPHKCIDSNVDEEIWICNHLNAYQLPDTQPADQPCIHRFSTCQECKTDHPIDHIYCTSPKKRQTK